MSSRKIYVASHISFSCSCSTAYCHQFYHLTGHLCTWHCKACFFLSKVGHLNAFNTLLYGLVCDIKSFVARVCPHYLTSKFVFQVGAHVNTVPKIRRLVEKITDIKNPFPLACMRAHKISFKMFSTRKKKVQFFPCFKIFSSSVVSYVSAYLDEETSCNVRVFSLL